MSVSWRVVPERLVLFPIILRLTSSTASEPRRLGNLLKMANQASSGTVCMPRRGRACPVFAGPVRWVSLLPILVTLHSWSLQPERLPSRASHVLLSVSDAILASALDLPLQQGKRQRDDFALHGIKHGHLSLDRAVLRRVTEDGDHHGH
jgi:hypothetical protein